MYSWGKRPRRMAKAPWKITQSPSITEWCQVPWDRNLLGHDMTWDLEDWVVHVEDAGKDEADPVEATLPPISVHLLGKGHECTHQLGDRMKIKFFKRKKSDLCEDDCNCKEYQIKDKSKEESGDKNIRAVQRIQTEFISSIMDVKIFVFLWCCFHCLTLGVSWSCGQIWHWRKGRESWVSWRGLKASCSKKSAIKKTSQTQPGAGKNGQTCIESKFGTVSFKGRAVLRSLKYVHYP